MPQGSVLDPILYFLFGANVSTITDRNLLMEIQKFICVDDAAIFSRNRNVEIATANLQNHLRKRESWKESNKIKINSYSCSHITFILDKKTNCQSRLLRFGYHTIKHLAIFAWIPLDKADSRKNKINKNYY